MAIPIKVICITFLVINSVISKPFKLRVLNLATFSNVPAGYGTTLRLAFQYVFEAVNNRSDILPEFTLETQFEDEMMGTKVPQLVMSYYSSLNHSDFIKSPLLVGPFYSNGCKAMGPLLHRMDAVALSPLCAASVLSNRTLYPNLFTMVSTTDPYTNAMVHFIEDAGKWRRIGIIANAAVLNDYMTAISIQRLAVQRNISVPVFNLVLEISNDAIGALQANDIRIVVVFASIYSVMWQFYCKAFQAGMSGPRYVFIANLVLVADAEGVPAEFLPNCTREMILSQQEITIFTGPSPVKLDVNEATSLGQTLASYQRWLISKNNNTKAPDFARFTVYYDAAMMAALALDHANKKLHQMNLSLKDYATFPTIVADAVNDSMMSLDLIGMRLSKLQYSRATGQQAADFSTISYWTRDKSIQQIFELAIIDNNNLSNYDNLYTRQTASTLFSWPYWFNNKPPKDQGYHLQVKDQVNSETFFSVAALAATITLSQITMIWLMEWFRHTHFDRLPRTIKFLFTLAYLLLNAAAVCFAWRLNQTDFENLRLANLRTALLSLGITLFHTCVCSRAVLTALAMRGCFEAEIFETQNSLPRQNHVKRGSLRPRLPDVIVSSSLMKNACHRSASTSNFLAVPSVTGTPFDVSTPPPSAVPSLSVTSSVVSGISQFDEDSLVEAVGLVLSTRNRNNMLISFVAIALTSIYLAVWLCVDPIDCTSRVSGQLIYDTGADTFVETLFTSCQSEYMWGWIAPLVFVNVITIVIGLMAVYYLIKTFPKILQRDFSYVLEYKFVAFTLINQFAVFVCLVLITVVLEGHSTKQQLTIAFGCLIESSLSFILLVRFSILSYELRNPIPSISISSNVVE